MVRPKKHFGQHFLTDQNIAQRIVDTIEYRPELNLLEIGPGKGVLTDYILKKETHNFKVAEIDRESVEHLRVKYQSNLSIVSEDVLHIDFNNLFDGANFSIIGNFPYNISSQILFKMLDNMHLVDELSGMFQREMARRVCADHGNKEYGILSVLVQTYYEVDYLFTVNEGVFFPPPKVKSGVIKLTRKKDIPEDISFKDFKRLIKLAFGQRRKQLRNTLKSELPENFQHEFLSKRPEQLSVQDLYDLCVEVVGRKS